MSITLEQLLTTPAATSIYYSFPLIPRGGRIIIGAPPKHLKSMLALNIAYDLAEGLPLFGLVKDGQPVWDVRRPLSVLYVEQEIGRWFVKERLGKIQAFKNGELTMHNLRFECKGSGITLDTPAGIATLNNAIGESAPDVLVLDPLRKFHSADEDSSTEMARVLGAVDELQKQHDGLTVVMLHHSGKRNEFRDGSDPESLRGSSHIYADGDSFIMVSRPIKNDETVVRLHFSLRSAATPKPVTLKLQPDTFTFARFD